MLAAHRILGDVLLLGVGGAGRDALSRRACHPIRGRLNLA